MATHLNRRKGNAFRGQVQYVFDAGFNHFDHKIQLCVRLLNANYGNVESAHYSSITKINNALNTPEISYCKLL